MTAKTKKGGPAKRTAGRPRRAEASAKALDRVDLESVDPRDILRQIAADASAPATARVAACRALIALDEGGADSSGAGDDPDQLTELAVQILKKAGRTK